MNGDLPFNTNLHSAWDAALIDKTAWSWGSYVKRLENGWLKTADTAAVSAGTTAEWANESHRMPAAMPVFSIEKLVRPWLSMATISPSMSAEPW
ncbi:hypothetical protein [Mesorhizobium sp.]|uniref:hypothetical protein n=1 Tax=Mesorhizobium sp. TaxID=1871066 RepID=UPI0025EAD7D6|nr:hypothetical protein [Mesorhizobium sp.]